MALCKLFINLDLLILIDFHLIRVIFYLFFRWNFIYTKWLFIITDNYMMFFWPIRDILNTIWRKKCLSNINNYHLPGWFVQPLIVVSLKDHMFVERKTDISSLFSLMEQFQNRSRLIPVTIDDSVFKLGLELEIDEELQQKIDEKLNPLEEW